MSFFIVAGALGVLGFGWSRLVRLGDRLEREERERLAAADRERVAAAREAKLGQLLGEAG